LDAIWGIEMTDRMASAVSWFMSRLSTLLILALLVCLAVWGARNDWKIEHVSTLFAASRTEDESAAPAIRVLKEPTGHGDADSELPLNARLEFPSAEAVAQAGIRVAPAQVRPIAESITAYGMVDYEPSYYAELSTRAPGTIWQVYKEIGDKLDKGDVLAVVESSEVGKAKGDFMQSLAQVDLRQQTVSRLGSAAGSVPEGSLRDAEAALREARIRLFNDQQKLLNLGLNVRIEEAAKLKEDQLVRHLRLLGLPDSIRQNVDPDTLTTNLLPLRAPFAGRVVTRRAAPGDVATTTAPQFVVADVRRIHLDLDVHPEDMRYVRLGQTVIFRPDGSPELITTAKVTHISPAVDEKSHNVTVHAEASNPDELLRPHTFGSGRIIIQERPDAVAVPTAAVQSEGDTQFVFVQLSDRGFRVRPVKTGLHDGEYREVTGVKPGEAVVTTGSHELKSELLKERIVGD
jgi:multidrug efflux pump subunit AcrA (membrane-fusion protein)